MSDFESDADIAPVLVEARPAAQVPKPALPRGGVSVVLVVSGACDLAKAFALDVVAVSNLLNTRREAVGLPPWNRGTRCAKKDMRVHGVAALEWKMLACPEEADAGDYTRLVLPALARSFPGTSAS